jgi:hypothetical protein
LSTARRAATLDVARSFDFTIVERLAPVADLGLAIRALLLENDKSPGRGRTAPEAPLPRKACGTLSLRTAGR